MAKEELVTLSKKELERVQVVREVREGHLTQRQASERLGLGVRQVKRLCKLEREEQAAGLISKRRGRPSNHQLDAGIKAAALRWVREKYADFGPTLACEKLAGCHGLELGRETLRQAMIEDGLWRPPKPRGRSHPRRERRARHGELVQMDGSLHAWFEDRGPQCTLVASIDDATSEVLAAQFVEVEDTRAYFGLLSDLLRQHGRPLQLYTDRHSIFRPVVEAHQGVNGETQLGRALRELDIELICANSPQAKGRVERLFGTFQDRLVRELRLLNVCTMAQANGALPQLLGAHNKAFAVVPASREEALRPLNQTLRQELEWILCCREQRQLSKTLTLQYSGILLQIETNRPEYALRHKKVQVVETRDRRLVVRYHGTTLRHRIVDVAPKQGRIADAKQIAQAAAAQAATG